MARSTSPSPSTDFHGYGPGIRREVARRIPPTSNLAVLDVGTGYGDNASFLLRHLSKKSRIWSIDPSKEVLAEVKATMSKEDLERVEFVKASADSMDFADGFFDVAVSVMVLHHVEKGKESLAELSRVLKSGGRLLTVDYKPEAHKLQFQSRHQQSDFVRPAQVAALTKELGLKTTVVARKCWYLVDSRKPRVSGSAECL